MERVIRKHRLFLRRGPAAFFARSLLDVAVAAVRRQPTAGELDDPRWPAHLHINVVPEVRGTGVAAALMSRWFDRLRDAGTPGCYLQTLVENTRAVRFFERMGFVAHGSTPLVPGLRHDGRKVHQLTMVRPDGGP
jgi:ribosomal protein S18 acetylase RimI-like enzyme